MPQNVMPSTGHSVGKSMREKLNTLDSGFLLKSIPFAPDDLNDEGVMWWNYYCGLFVEGQILSRMYLTSLHNLCIMHMLRQGMLQELADQESIMLTTIVKSKDSETIKRTLNPIAISLSEVLLKMDKLLASLGMTAYTARINDVDTGTGKEKGKTLPPSSSLSLPGAK